ncbi:MAG: hypothetical protein HQ541_07605 [Mariniphaga sp.]|nr:hypothetical protein [Mariniphaga sp.]
MEKNEIIENLLPGYNCGICGYSNCREFAMVLQIKSDLLPCCTVLSQYRFENKRIKIEALLNNFSFHKKEKILGLIDNVEADIILKPLTGEPSCREILVSFSSNKVSNGDLIKYRPLGCPITHFSRVIETNHGLLEVWVEGPCIHKGINEIPVELGICMILSFRGIIEGDLPNIGQTIKFLPNHCMMGKVHAGIIVQIEDNTTRIDCIDLKVWRHAQQFHS